MPFLSHPAEEDSSAGLSNIPIFSDEDTTVTDEFLADDVLIYGVGRREAEDESSHCNHDNS